METQRIEYIRKNGRKKGRKKGVMWCGINPDDANKVMVGFSICNSLDRFDWIDGNYCSGFGVDLAETRAEKWASYTDYFVQKSYTEPMLFDDEKNLVRFINPNPKTIVEVPPSILDRLNTFINRCKRYYKDKEFPLWTDKLVNNDSYDEDLLDEEEIYVEFE